jgi:cyclophilin family peptidyl-prolyl cis-trans isomerase
VAAAIEPLESRKLLSVSISQQITPVTLTAGTNSATVDLSQDFTDPQTTGTFVQFDTSLGKVEVQLFDQQTPLTVANFLQYVNQGLYNNTIIHRSVPDFVVQGGGFTASGTAIQTFAPVQNEPVFSNTLGTIAMAKVAGDPNSATSQFFFNAADNSSTLDNQNGGFTVFGDVIEGLNVVEAINQLSTVSTTLGTNSFPNLPVISSSGGTQPGNLVDVSTVQTVAAPQITITAVSDNTRLVTTSINGEQLTLVALPGQTGFAHVTVTATGPSGTSVTEVVRVHVLGAQTLNVALGAGNAHAVSYHDANGNAATVSLTGPGGAVASFSGSNLSYRGGAVHGQGVQLDSLTATGTTAASSVVINGPASAKDAIAIGDITITGSTAQIRLHHALLVGDLAASGSARKLVIDSAEEGSISIGSGSAVTVEVGSLTAETLTSGAPIESLKVGDWVNPDPAAVITAPSIKSITSKGSVIVGLDLSAASHALAAINVKGYIGGQWTVAGNLPKLRIGGIADTFSGTFTSAIPSLHLKLDMNGSLSVPSIGNLRVDGSMTNSLLRLTAPLTANGTDLKTLRVKGQIAGSTIVSTGNIGSVSAKGISLTDIFAGIGQLATNEALPTSESEFASHASIAAVDTRGVKKALGYSGSNIAAWTVGKLELGTTATKNSGTTYGIAGHTIGTLSTTDTSKRQTFSFSHITSATALAKLIAARKLTLNDFSIAVL